jgi:hypothetical protein
MKRIPPLLSLWLPCVAALCGVVPACLAQPADAAIRIAMPQLEPQPDAALLYCRERLSTTLTAQSVGLGARIDKSPTDPLAHGSYLVRLSFEGKALRVAQSVPTIPGMQRGLFGTEMSYKVLSDRPDNVVASSDEDIEIGALMVISLNRLVSTMVLTTTYSSIPDQGHPYASSTFYGCTTTPP